MKDQTEKLKPVPGLEAEGWLGYQHFTDPTRLPFNVLTYPSINCFMPSKDKIVPRKGKTRLGGTTDEDIETWPVIGHKERFTTRGGDVLEVRVLQSDDEDLRDIIEVLYPDPSTGILTWYQITLNENPLAVGLHRYYMDDWFDTNLDPAESLRLPRLIWVNGNMQVYSWIGAIAPIIDVTGDYLTVDYADIEYSSASGPFTVGETITGGTSSATGIVAVAPAPVAGAGTMQIITMTGTFQDAETITGGTSGETATIDVFTPASITWASLGFESTNPDISINGEEFTIDAGWDTGSVHLTATPTGVVADDLAFSAIRADDVDVPFDVCKNNKNYMYYGNWESRSLFQSNNYNRDPSGAITIAQAALNDILIPTTSEYSGLGSATFRITITGNGSPNQFKWTKDGGAATTGVNITGSAQTLSDGVQIQFSNTTGHTIGDYWEIQVVQGVDGAWFNFYYTLPVRRPGEGYIYQLPSNFWAMDTQEKDLYVNTQYGYWDYVSTELGADLQTETISLVPLKHAAASKVIFPYMTTHLDNDLVFVTENKTLDTVGRREFLELPQISYLSQPVSLDFDACSFENGSMKYLNKLLYITSPSESLMLVYDNRKDNQYWQPPQVINENGILSIVENKLITHSNIRNLSFNLFTGASDDGAQYTVRARTAFTAGFKDGRQARWDSKFSNNSFVEGYVSGNPELVFTAFRGVNDATGMSHIIQPVFQNNPADTASIGESVLAGHPLGNDPAIVGIYFNEIYNKFKPIISFYFIALQVACVSKNHTWAILSLGMNATFAPTGNNTLIGDREVF